MNNVNEYTIKEVKENQKKLAAEIKELKAQRKKTRDGFVLKLWSKSWEYRHWHIAYCLFRGRQLEEIERTNRIDNHPMVSKYERYLSRIKPTFKVETFGVGNG